MRNWELEEHHIKLLTLAAQEWDKSQMADEVIRKEGLTHPDRFGQVRERPEVRIARDAKALFARLLRELALDIESPGEPGRPPGAIALSARRKF